MAIKSYDDFKNKKSDLEKYLYSVAKVVDGLNEIGLKISGQALLDLKEKVKNDRFKVLVIGEFKNGKSTFIDALMGEKILPAYNRPCTAVINEVVYGKEKKATLYFKEPLPCEISDNIEPKVMQYIKKYNGENVPPMDIDVSDLNKYVTIPDPEKDHKEAIKEVPYSKVVLEYPIELCRNGIEIIDSPGLNEDGARTKVTEEYLNKADAVLFVFNCTRFCSQLEINYITNHIHTRGHKEIFFICNKINQVDDEEQEDIKEFGYKKLLPLTELGKKGIFYVNALDALKAKPKKDAKMLTTTGIPDFEIALSEYLRNNRGKTKLLSVVTPFLENIKSTNKHICEYRAILDQNIEEFEKRVSNALPNFELAIQKKQVVANKIDLAMEELSKKISYLMNVQYDKIINDIPDAVDKMDIENKITSNAFKQNKQKKALEDEVIEKLKAFVQKEMSDWIKTDLNETIDSFIDGLENDLGRDIDVFYANLDEFRYEVSGIERPRDINGLGRVAAAIVGTVVGGPTYGMLGATVGFGEMVKRSAITLGAATAAGVIFAFTPLGAAAMTTIVALATVASGLAQIATGGKFLTDKFKDKVKQEFVEKLKEHKEEDSDNYAKKLVEGIKEKFDFVQKALDNEIEIEKSKIEALKKDKEKSEKECKNEMKLLSEFEKNLEEVKIKLEKMETEIKKEN